MYEREECREERGESQAVGHQTERLPVTTACVCVGVRGGSLSVPRITDRRGRKQPS